MSTNSGRPVRLLDRLMRCKWGGADQIALPDPIPINELAEVLAADLAGVAKPERMREIEQTLWDLHRDGLLAFVGTGVTKAVNASAFFSVHKINVAGFHKVEGASRAPEKRDAGPATKREATSTYEVQGITAAELARHRGMLTDTGAMSPSSPWVELLIWAPQDIVEADRGISAVADDKTSSEPDGDRRVSRAGNGPAEPPIKRDLLTQRVGSTFVGPGSTAGIDKKYLPGSCKS